MEDNDIGVTVHKHVACMFEHLLITPREPPDPDKKTFFGRKKPEVALTDDQIIAREVRTWKANEMPLKSVIHMTTKLGIGVEVYTYYDPMFKEAIEHWLARKGASVQVWPYLDLNDLREDFRYNRDVHTLFTPFEEDAKLLGMRATVVHADGTFGI